ncbi:MAG TPA: Fic family protein [Dongiaceae bacterium]|nr:Fic family protein [Dongiaceae bacterium]
MLPVTSGEPTARHSKAEVASLVSDEDERAKLEARNALQQFDLVLKLISDSLSQTERPFKLRPSMIQSLHREALNGLSQFAGNWRPAGVEIGQSKHTPPGAHLVAELIENMCDYVNDNWSAKSPIHLAAYIMWRLNWIHPLMTAMDERRAQSHISCCVLGGGMALPGRNTIPEQISTNKEPYYKALERADEADRAGNVDVSALEALMSDYLAAQLVGIFNSVQANNVAEEHVPKLH